MSNAQAKRNMSEDAGKFVCPACKGELAVLSGSYSCSACQRIYPVLFGIPDFRLRSDRYLSLEEERKKAQRLHTFGVNASFDRLVEYYYSITYDLPPNMALRFQAYVHSGPERARQIIPDLQPTSPQDLLIDLGCGTGGLLVAASKHFRGIYGLDIALRWLVICQKRLQEAGVSATLVCADVEAMPFPDGTFSHAVAADLIEHVYDVDEALAQIRRHLRPKGKFWLSAVNRYCIGPHPLTGIWGIGFLPQAPRAFLLRKLKGIDLLRHTNLISPGALTRLLKRHGFLVQARRPRQVAASFTLKHSALNRMLLALYRMAIGIPVLRSALLRIGPAFEMVSMKPECGR